MNSVLLPAIVGSVYWDIGLNQSRCGRVGGVGWVWGVGMHRQLAAGTCSINDRISAISFMLILQAFMAIDAIVLWPSERKVYLRDQVRALGC